MLPTGGTISMGIRITDEATNAAAAHAGVPPAHLGAHLGVCLDQPLSMAAIAAIARALPGMPLQNAFRHE